MLGIHRANNSHLSGSHQSTAVSKILVAFLAAVVIGLAGMIVAAAAPGFADSFFKVIQEGTAVGFLLLIPGLLIGGMVNQVRKRFRS